MYKNDITEAFTLGEIMVWIAIIWILAFGISSIDFNRLSKNQQSEIEVVKIINLIEEAKNNALIWRWVGINLDTPDNWSVDFDTTSWWDIESSWNLWATTWSWSNWTTKKEFEITNLRCQTIDGLTDDSNISAATIVYTWSIGWIIGCSDNTFKKLVFDFWSAWDTTEISINAVTGVIEKR